MTALHPAGWSLRTRLLGALMLLVLLVYALLAVTSTLALRSFLVERLDTQLAAAGGRSVGYDGPRRPQRGDRDGPDPGIGFLGAPGQRPGTVGAYLPLTGQGRAGLLTESGSVSALPEDAVDALEAVTTGPPQTIDVAGLGDYRAVAARTPDGDVFVTALALRPVNETVLRLVGVQAALGVAALALAAVAATVIVRRTLRPLDRVAGVATRVSALPLERGEVELAERVPGRDTDPRTEVGQVGAALNRLLDAVGGALTARQASETRVRQFVADASHELRTPLAAIRGYAELTRRSREPVPDDVAHALSRVESEAVRMTGLVDDLLLLARLDSGRPLERGPVDLTGLVVDTLGDASAAGPDHRWRLELPDEPVVVGGDRSRLHQVLANLLANARVHTPAGTHVTARLSVGDDVLLEVVDDGPGIAPQLQASAFERFARGDSSRGRQGGAGTGLGLSIVAAIVEAHGGGVSLASEPGRTCFAVRLPRS